MKFLDFFSGIGGFRLGMEMAGHECIGHCEKDKFANRSYVNMHKPKEGEWYGTDITKVRASELPRADAWCFGFPCQDISIAGEQTGLKGARSGLFYTVLDLNKSQKEENKPPILFIENVKNLLSVNDGWDFTNILISLDEAGYDAEWQVLNSKNFGVPQNRERVFIIGHLRGRSRRKVFPIGGSIATSSIKVIGTTKSDTAQGTNCRSWVHGTNGIMGALTSTDYKQPKQVLVNDVAILRSVRTEYGRAIRKDYESGNIQESRHNMTMLEPRTDGISNTITTVQKDNLLYIREATKKGYAEAIPGDSINLAVPGSKTRRGRVGKGVANTLDTSCNQGTLVQGRIRRLTPLECFRLQGFPDEYFYRAKEVNSDSQLYKQAGNSVTVNVIYEIAKRL